MKFALTLGGFLFRRLESTDILDVAEELAHRDGFQLTNDTDSPKLFKGKRKLPNFKKGCPECKDKDAAFSYQELSWDTRSFWVEEDGSFHAGGTSKLVSGSSFRTVIICNECGTEFPAPPDGDITFGE